MDQNEMNYKIQVEGPVYHVMEQVERDASQFGIEHDDFIRAVFCWASEQLLDVPTGQWMYEHHDHLSRLEGEKRTIQGDPAD